MDKNVVIDVPVTSSHLGIIFGVGIVLFLIVVAVLIHHWNYYGIKDNPKIFVKSIYFIFSFFLLFISGVSLILFNV